MGLRLELSYELAGTVPAVMRSQLRMDEYLHICFVHYSTLLPLLVLTIDAYEHFYLLQMLCQGCDVRGGHKIVLSNVSSPIFRGAFEDDSLREVRC